MQKITLNLIPDGVPPVVYVNQFDVGREFQISFKEGLSPYNFPIPSSVVFRINGRKADNHVFEYTESDKWDATHYIITKSGSGTSLTVTIATSEQMTAAAGNAEVQLTFKSSSASNDILGTLNFILAVQEQPYANGDPSGSDFPEIIAMATEQMERAEDAAQDAEAAAAHYPYPGDDGYWYVWDVETEQFVKTDVSAAGRAPDITMTATADATSSSTPTVTVTKTGTEEEPNFALAFSGLKGAKGDTGPIGPTGDSQDVLEAVGWVGSNLFEGRDTVSGGSGITITRQNDKKYLVTGTNSSATDGKVYLIGKFTFKANISYVIQGCPAGGGGSATANFWLGVYVPDTSTIITRDYGEGRTYTPAQDTEADIKIRVPAAYVCPANFLWDVMISRNGGEYVPYHPTVQEELWDGEVAEPKNVLPLSLYFTPDGVTATVNKDSYGNPISVTLEKSATTSSDRSVVIKVPSTVSGNYYFSGCPSGGREANTYDIYMYDTNTSERCKKWNGTSGSSADTGQGDCECQIVAGHITYLMMRLGKNYTTPAGGLTFYPMLSLYKGAYSPYYVPLKDVVPTKFNNSNVAPTEDGAGASQAYSTGQYLIHGGKLRKATTAIASGAEITNNNTSATTLAEILELNKNELVSGIATLNGNPRQFDISDATLDCVVNRFARRISIMFRGVTLLQQLSVAGALTIMTVETGYWGLISSLGIATVRKDNTYYRALISKNTTNTALLIVALEAIPAGAVIAGYIEWPY